MYWIARFTLFAMMLLTCCDVFLRYVFNRPIIGAYDLVALLGSVVISFSIPRTTLNRGHVIMEALTEKLSERARRVFSAITRCLGIVTFIFIGWNLLIYGNILRSSGEVFPTLRMPIFYPAYAMGLCCFVECLALFYGLLLTFKTEASR